MRAMFFFSISIDYLFIIKDKKNVRKSSSTEKLLIYYQVEYKILRKSSSTENHFAFVFTCPSFQSNSQSVFNYANGLKQSCRTILIRYVSKQTFIFSQHTIASVLDKHCIKFSSLQIGKPRRRKHVCIIIAIINVSVIVNKTFSYFLIIANS